LFVIGELVLLQRPRDIREGHKLRGRGTGPWRIQEVLNDAVYLDDAFTGRPMLDDVTGMRDPINVDRLIRFVGSADALEVMDLEDQITLANARVGSYVAFLNSGSLFLLKVVEVVEEFVMKGVALDVPAEERHGASSRQPWGPVKEEQIQVLWEDILCLVALDEVGCLTPESVQRLRRLRVEPAK
jgi:hypothetical protein